MLYNKLLLLTALSISFSLNATNKEPLDSLKIEVLKMSDKEKISFYYEHCTDYSASPQKAKNALFFLDEAIELSEKMNDKDSYYRFRIEKLGAQSILENDSTKILEMDDMISELKDYNNLALIQRALVIKGNELEQMDLMSDAKKTYLAALDYAITLKDTSRQGVIYNNLGNIANKTSRNEEAIKYYLQSLTLREKGDLKNLNRTYNNISQIYKRIGDYEKSILYNQKAIQVQVAQKNVFGQSISYLNLGNTYRHMGQYDSSIYYNKEALRLSESINDTIGFAFAFYNLGSSNFSKKDFHEAIKYYKKAYPIYEKGNMKSYAASTLNSLSASYRSAGNLKKAEYYLIKAEVLSKDLNSFSLKENIHQNYYYIYKDQGNYKEALKHSELYKQYADSVLNESQLEKIASLEKDYEIKDRDNKIALLDKENELAELKITQQNLVRKGLILLIFMTFIVAFVLFSKYNAKRKTERILSLKNQALDEANHVKDQFFSIIAHELRNPLSAFKMLTNGLKSNLNYYSKEEIEDQLNELRLSANSLSELLQNLLQWSLSQTDRMIIQPIDSDVKVVLDNVIQHSNSFAQQRGIKINNEKVNNSMIKMDIQTMEFVFRNLIINSIKFSPSDSEVIIETNEHTDFLKVSIKDHGIGMSENDVEKLFQLNYNMNTIGNSPNKGSGLGLLLVKEFVSRNNGRIEVHSQLSKGTTIDIYLPKY
ncbi:tetratricopeptide repeat protein [Flammeovirga yaeyamensis]|uniref:histidine kinase n=1 Tax=Flammeovirga yaeyamensis TaxID=367791 RepID=A0AAX1N9I9_9BACT|nr:tetratricopeptide repeat-containing sensor histidine kinase [Flammeovirga yaeyamensis]MBB3699402.1 signal transduction histidine kinase [Flammeovirga yaeyamensis]NMF35339.1 sensor histidine kinase [Flammeovirga yaeyamensis]QWG04199.1 tetratricopeptide repeat protein [Flammeovirga yaeyamensis]